MRASMGRASLGEVGSTLSAAYQDLLASESRLSETLAPRGIRFASSVVDQWPTLHDYLSLYGRSLSAAGVLVLAGGPDEGSRLTGVPFTGPAAARERLGLEARGEARSPSEDAFWDAVAIASPVADAVPLESLFSLVHLTHARPFDVEATPEVKDASARHVLRLLKETRPQAIVAVGHEALHVLARALGDARVLDVAAIPEGAWCEHWPPQTPLLRYPYVEVPVERPFRARLVPLPALDGPHRVEATESLAGVLAYAWAA